jgi:hypothetical protein
MTKPKTKTNSQNIPRIAPNIHKRGCGWPYLLGLYLSVTENKFSAEQMWTQMVVDPTFPLPEGFGLTGVSMILKERTLQNGKTVYDLWDWIGSDHYPNPLDWLLEVMQLGFHQKVNAEQMKYITEDSYYFAVHSRAGYVDPTGPYATRIPHPEYPNCPTKLEAHAIQPGNAQAGDYLLAGTCPGLFFSDIIKGTKPEKDSRVTVRNMPSFDYDGFVAQPDIVPDLEYQPAAFFKLNIGRWAELWTYADNETEEQAEQKALDLLEELDAKFQRVKIVKM